MDEKLKTCAEKLYHIGAIQFGTFTLKSGIVSPIYVDLRLLVSYPDLLQHIASMMWKQVAKSSFDCICGVPYTALPIATALSLDQKIPMVMRRKEIKEHGTKKAIEGSFEKGQTCLVIEDLITSGASIFETIEPLENVGLKIKEIVVLLDRQQGGKRRVEEKGYTLHSVLTMNDLLTTLGEKKLISPEMAQTVDSFLRANQC